MLRYPQVEAEGLADWRFFLMRLHARFRTGSFVKGLELVTRITEAAEEANHHPDVVLTYPQVDVDLHQPRRRRRHQPRPRPGPADHRDRGRARRRAGARARSPRSSSRSTCPTRAAVKPFWAAVLGYGDAQWDDRDHGPGRPQQHALVPGGPRRHGRGAAAVPPRHRGPARGRRGARRAPRSPPAAPWSARTRCRRSGCSPTPTATRSASARRTAASRAETRPQSETGVPDPGTPVTLG